MEEEEEEGAFNARGSETVISEMKKIVQKLETRFRTRVVCVCVHVRD